MLEYGTAADFTGATSIDVSGTPATQLRGLSSSTTYYARVKANCGSEQSNWAIQTVTFMTKQVPVVVGDGWSDDFEGTNNWLMFNGGNNAWVIGTAANNGGEQAMYISNDDGATNAYTTGATNIVYAIKFMTFATGQYIVTYDWRADGESSYDYLRAWIAPSSSTFTANQLPDGSTSTYYYTSSTPEGWIPLDGGSKLNVQSDWQAGQTTTVDVSAGDYYVVFMWANDNSSGTQPPAAIDNFNITKVACAAPAAFAASNVAGHTATLGWTSDGSAWQVAYTTEAEANPDDLTAIDVTENTYPLAGLTSETTYYAYVRTVCGTTYSAWSSTTFTTTVACPAPTGLSCTALTTETATLTWTETGIATDWVIEYGTDATFAAFTTVNVSSTPTTVLEGLTPETVYYARVKTNCGDEDGYSLYSSTLSFEPTAKLVIGSGTTTSGYLPGYFYYNYSLSQQIYTVAELGEAGMIESIDFYCASSPQLDRNIDIYVVSTDKNTLSDDTDWITITGSDLVYSGKRLLTQGWNTFEFESPFIYDGQHNVAIIVKTEKDTNYENGIYFSVFEADSQAIYTYSDNTNFDPMTPPTSYTSYESHALANIKNQIRVLKSAISSCLRPKNLEVANVTNHTADLTWTPNGEETAWQICVNGDEDHLIDVTENPSYNLTGLAAETAQVIMVRANCGEGEVSEWARITFTTDIACPIPTDLTITDVTYNSATISWNGVADAYEMEYGISTGGGTTTFDFEDGTLQGWTNLVVNTDGGSWLHSSAQPYGYDYTALAHGGTGFALCYSFIDYTGSFDTDAYLVSPNSYQINAGASMVFYYDMANDSYPEYFEVCVATVADPTADDFTAIWALDNAKGNNGQTADVRMRDNTRSGNWREVTLDLSNYIGQTIWIAFHDVNYDAYEVWIDDVTIDAGAAGEVEWIAVEGTVTSPYTLEGLNDVTPYIVKVRAICGGEDGESGWSYTTFTTHGICDAPSNLIVTDIYKDGATFNWTGLQDNYKLQYRTAAYFDDSNPEFFEDFEEGIPDTWTTIDADEDGNNWFALDDLMDIYSYYTTIPDWAHNSSNAAMSPSYANGAGAFNSDHWLITPQIELGGTLRFYARSMDATYKDSYEVLLSTTTADITEFTETLQVMAAASANSWDEVLIDLSAYADQPGYIAIHHVSENMYFLVIDDFGIYPSEADVPAGEWVELPNQVTSPYPITGLAQATSYEWQVRGLNRPCPGGTTEWSDIASFISHDGIIFTTEGDWNVAGNWYLNEVPAEDKDVCIEAPATIPAGYDAVVGTVTFMEGGSITIADGGQLHHDTDSLMVTMEKNITAYTDAEGKDNYYLLAVPFMEGALVPEGMTAATDYDFYMYDNSKTQQEWRNNREEAIDTLKMFKGYLYANPADIQFSWSGSTYPTYGVAYTVAYDATETDDDILGWRLLGNPLTCNAYIYDSNWNPINVMYYDENGDMQTFVTGPVPPMQGFFVKITQNTTFYMVSFEVDSAKGVSSHVIGLEKKTDNSQENWKRK